MKTISETVTRRGIVVEEVIRGCLPGCKRRIVAYSDEDCGVELFNDLTDGASPGQHTGWETLEGFCRECNRECEYRRMFVVTHIVRTTEEC